MIKKIIYISLLIFSTKVQSQKTDPKIELADSIYYSDPDRSCQLCEEAEKRAKSNSDYDIIADAQLCKARYYLLKTDYKRAERNIVNAINHFEKLGNKNRLASAYNLYSIFYGRMNDITKSYDYQNEAIRLFKETKNIQGMTNLMNNLANAYIQDGRLSHAKEILDEIVTYKDRISQPSLYFYFQNYGYYLMVCEKQKEAIENFNKALSIAQNQKMRDSEITAMTYIGRAYLRWKKFKDAELILSQAELLAKAIELDFELTEIYLAQIDLFKAQNNSTAVSKAQSNLSNLEAKMKAKIIYQDKIRKEKKIKELEIRKKIRKKEKELLEARSVDRNKNRLMIPLVIGGVLLIIGSVLIFRRKRQS